MTGIVLTLLLVYGALAADAIAAHRRAMRDPPAVVRRRAGRVCIRRRRRERPVSRRPSTEARR